MPTAPYNPRRRDEEKDADVPSPTMADEIEVDFEPVPSAPVSVPQPLRGTGMRPTAPDAFAPGGIPDAPNLQTRRAVTKVQLGQPATQRDYRNIAQRQGIEQQPALQSGGEGMDAPDLMVRTAALKAQAGAPLSNREIDRLNTRQALEAQQGNLPAERSVSTLLAGSRLDPRGTRAEQAAEARRLAAEQKQQARAQEIQARREFNSRAMAEYKKTGARYYTDPATGRLTPVVDEKGRQLYYRSDWEPGVDPQGKPAKVMRDEYGQRQFKRPTVVASPDAHDDFLYADMGDGESVPYMKIEEAVAHPDFSLQRTALAARRRRNETMHREALAPVKAMADQAQLEYDSAKEQIAQIQGQIETAMQQSAAIDENTLKETEGGFLGIGAKPTGRAQQAQSQRDAIGARMQQLQAAQMQLEDDLKPGGRLARAKVMGAVGLKLATATAVRDAYRDQEQEILARLRFQGKDAEADPMFIENRKRLQEAEAVIQGANKERQRYEQLFNAAAPTAAAPVPPTPAEGTSTLGGIVNVAERAGRQSLAAMDVLGASNRARKRDEYLAQADKLEQQAANVATLQPSWSAENQAAWAERARQSAAKLRERAGAMGESMGAQLAGATEQLQKASLLKAAEGYQKYSDAEKWDAVKAFLSNPVEVATNIAAEGALGSIPALVMGAAGAVTGGVPGMAGGTAIGSFATEYAGSLLESFEQAGVDLADPAALAAAFDNPQIMADAQKRGTARGIPVAVFDALSGGLAGRTIRGGVSQALKAGAREVGEQAALGAAGETAGQVSEQVAMTGEVGDLSLGDIAAEAIGELVPGSAQVAIGAATRKRGQSAAAEAPPPGGAAQPATDAQPPPAAPTLASFAKANLTAEQAEARLKAEAANDPELAALLAESKSAAESAEVFEPALKERANTPPPATSAAESARAFIDAESEERGLAVAEQGAQALVDELQEVSGKSREEILATRTGKDVAQWAEELQGEIEYAKNPLTVDPERRRRELAADLSRINKEWEAHLADLAGRAEQAAASQGARELAGADFAGLKARHDELMARRDAIAIGLEELQRIRQSPAGASLLATDLAEEARVAEQEARRLRTPDLEGRRDAIETELEKADRIRQSPAGGAALRADLAARERGQEPPSNEPASPTPPRTPTAPAGTAPRQAEVTDEPAQVPEPAPTTEPPTPVAAAESPVVAGEAEAAAEPLPKKVRIAGAEFDVVKRNPDGTITVRNAEGGEFDTAPGEQWEPVAEEAPRAPRAIDFSRTTREQFIADELGSKERQRKIALMEAENAIRKGWKPAKPLPVGINKLTAFLAKDRHTGEERKLLTRYQIAKRNLESDTRADADVAGRVYDRLKASKQPSPSPEPPVSTPTEITPEAEGAQGAPAQPTQAEDYARYQAIQREWADLRKRGVRPDQDEIRKLWAENEEIKNRYGGMPPEEAAKTETAEERFDRELREERKRAEEEMAKRPQLEQAPDFWVRKEIERIAAQRGWTLQEARTDLRDTLQKMFMNGLRHQVRTKKPIHQDATGERWLGKVPTGYVLEGDTYVHRAPTASPSAEPTPPTPRENPPDTPVATEQSEPGGGQISAGGNQPDPNIGRTWNSRYGKQTITGIVPGPSKLYSVITEGTGAERRYSADSIEDTIKKNEYELTPEYAKEQKERNEIAQERKERDARQAAREKKELDDINAFTAGDPPMAAGKKRDALLKLVSHNGTPMTRKRMIERSVEAGSAIRVVNGKRELTKPDGSFLAEDATTKAGMDYAAHLIEKRSEPGASPAVKEPTPPTPSGDAKPPAQMKRPALRAEASQDFDAEETKSGTTYQYRLAKEDGKWTAQIRIKGGRDQWESGVGVGRHSTRKAAAERFAARFPDAALAASDPEIRAIAEAAKAERDQKAATEAKQKAEAAEANRAAAEKSAAYMAEVRAVPLKGKSQQITLNRVEDGKDVGVPTQAMVYGDWAIHKVTIGKMSFYSVTHVPSGKRAQQKDTLAQAKEMVQAFIHAGIDVSKADLGTDKATLKRLTEVAIAVNTGQVPSWFGKEGGPQPAVAPVEPPPTPAPAQMKAPALRAELRAAGVESVSGVPLDDANAAQLMAAVGKLRRGQLETPATPTTDKLLQRLQETKKRKLDEQQGKVFDATEGLYRAAEIAALDIAILAVRAGRPVEQAIRMAVARFKARYPNASADELAKAEASVRGALAEPPPAAPTEPESKKSLLPESLKERNAPVQSIEYEVRSQEERKREASEFVAKNGAAAAERALADEKIPGDTRVAIGGQLLNDRMLALKEAKPEDIPKITRDIQRITAAMQPKLATEAGQTIAMFNAIYGDVGVAAGLEYVRDATAKRIEKMGGDEAGTALDEATKILNDKALTDADKKKAIDKLRDRYTTKPVRRVLDQLQRIEVAKELNKLGALTRDDLVNVAGNALGMPGISQDKLKHIAELADKIKSAKTLAERTSAEIELSDMLTIYKGVSPMDLEASILTLNILSGYTTQLRNLGGNAMQAFANLATTALTNPTKVGALTRGLVEGLQLGGAQAKSILATGRGTRDFADKTGGSTNLLQTVDYARDFPGLNPTVGNILTKRARLAEKVGRFMKAADAVFYYPAREAYARMMATKLLEGEYKGAELAKKVSETLRIRPEDFASARKQAEAEGFTGVDLGRRISDIIEANRAETAIGAEAVKQSERFAAESTYTNEPVGLAGVIYRNLSRTVKESDVGGVPVLKPWAMFLKTPANVFNATTNWTPAGALRAARGMKGEKYRKGATGEGQWRNFTAEERSRLYLQSIIGTSIMGAMVANILADEDQEIDISASGPTDPNKRRQLQAAGWSPYSIRIGGKRISYKDSPLLVPLAIVGHVADAVRYQKTKSDLVLESKVLDAVASAPNVIFQTSMLSGLSDLMAAMSGKGGGPEAITRTLSSIPANLTIPYNRLLQQIDQTFDNQSYEVNPLVGSVPFARRTGIPMTDVQGRARTYSPLQAFGTVEGKDKVDTLLRDKGLFISEPSKDTKIGNRVMTEDEYRKYRQLSGQRIRVRLEAIVPRLRIMTKEAADKEIERITREERERAKRAVIIGAPAKR